MGKKYVPSVYAIYFIGIAWLVCGAFFKLYTLSGFLITSGISALAYALAAKILPKQEDKNAPVFALTNDEKVNEVIKEADKTIKQIRLVNDKLLDAGISAKISEIEVLTKKIFDFIADNPKELTNVRRFVNYYLPTTLKLLETYLTLENQGDVGKNISETKEKINSMLTTIIQAFKKQLDSLFAYTALDTNAEISTMQTILVSEGLATDENNEINLKL